MQSLLTFEFLCFKHNSYTRYTVDTLTYINNNLFSTKQFNKFLYTCIVKFRFLKKHHHSLYLFKSFEYLHGFYILFKLFLILLIPNSMCALRMLFFV